MRPLLAAVAVAAALSAGMGTASAAPPAHVPGARSVHVAAQSLAAVERFGLAVRARIGRRDRALRLRLLTASPRALLAARSFHLKRGGKLRVRWRLRAATLARLSAGRYVLEARAGRRVGRLRGRTRRDHFRLRAGRQPGPGATPAPTPSPAPIPPGSTAAVTVAAAGDIACPGECGQAATASLITDVIRPSAVLGLGDFQYDTGTLANFAAYYTPSWGRIKPITYAINGGSHDFYGTGDWLTYFNNGGPVQLQPEGSYSFDLGAWHVLALNSYCFERSSCDEAAWSAWLRDDLARHPVRCTLAFWHQPYWTSPNDHAPKTELKPWVQALYDAGVDVLLQAHNHDYERFAPQSPDGVRDDARGLVAFVVGTGGRSHYTFSGPPAPNSAVRNDDTYGVLALTLRPDGFDYRFVPEPRRSFSDSGSGACH